MDRSSLVDVRKKTVSLLILASSGVTSCHQRFKVRLLCHLLLSASGWKYVRTNMQPSQRWYFSAPDSAGLTDVLRPVILMHTGQLSGPTNGFPPLPRRTHPSEAPKTLKEKAIKNESFCPQWSARLSSSRTGTWGEFFFFFNRCGYFTSNKDKLMLTDKESKNKSRSSQISSVLCTGGTQRRPQPSDSQ